MAAPGAGGYRAAMLVLLALPAALAHGSEYALTAISTAGPDDRHLWGVTDNWGILASHDAGATWEWYCEEGLESPSGQPTLGTTYDVEALDDGTALLAGIDGLLHMGDTCGLERVPGQPETVTLAEPIRRFGDRWLVGIYSQEGHGAFSCTVDGCEPTELVATDRYTKSFAVDGDTAYATTVTAGTYDAALWRSTDGYAWEPIATWPEGSPDMRILDARGSRLLVWAQARVEGEASTLRRSDDGGASWAEVLAFGGYTDAVPALLAPADGAFLRIGNSTLRVYQSVDDGLTWVDLNAAHPETVTLRCVSDDGRWVCADHFADGFDVGRVVGLEIEAAGCIDAATPASCLGDTCDRAYDDFLERGGYGGGECEADLTATPPSGGCTAGAAAAGLLAGLGLLVAPLRRQRPGIR